MFEALNNTPDCVDSQFMTQSELILDWSVNTESYLVSNITTLTLWVSGTVLPVQGVPPITITIPFVNYVPMDCITNDTELCEGMKKLFR